MDGGGYGGGGSDPGGVPPGLGGVGAWGGAAGTVSEAEAKVVLVLLALLIGMCCLGGPILGVVFGWGSDS